MSEVQEAVDVYASHYGVTDQIVDELIAENPEMGQNRIKLLHLVGRLLTAFRAKDDVAHT